MGGERNCRPFWWLDSDAKQRGFKQARNLLFDLSARQIFNLCESRIGPMATPFSSGRLPFAALNEYLCVQVLEKVLPSARVEVSRDANALVVYRFDVDDEGQPLWGMEDFCALLGLRPAQKRLEHPLPFRDRRNREQ
jgi:hypothetical protein